MKRFWQSMSIVAAVCLVLAACGITAGAQSGLLLGLHRGCGEDGCATEHRTLWIAPQGGNMQILELPDLIVPRKTGFWRVGTRFYCDPEELKNDPHKEPSPDGVFFAAPVDQRPIVYGVAECPKHVHYLDTGGMCPDNSADGATGINISFVNDEYISLDDWGRTDCGAHPDGVDNWSVEKLGDPARAPVAYGDIEGNGASDEYERRAAHALLEQNRGIDNDGHPVPFGEGDDEDEKDIRKNFPNWPTMSEVAKVAAMETRGEFCFPEHHDEWYIQRKRGQWIATGNVRIPRLCGYFVDFELPLHASFAAYAAGPISPIDIRDRITIKDVRDLKMIKGVKDLFWSPDHEILVVIVNMEAVCISNPIEVCSPRDADPDYLDQKSLLQVYSPHGQDLGAPVISMQLEDFETIVMAEWAAGSNVARWTAELKKIKAQGVVKPVLSSSPHP